MEPNARDILRRGVRAAVYRACWRRLEGDEAGAQDVLACEIPAVRSTSPDTADDALVSRWLDEDVADFDRAVLISDLVAKRAAWAGANAPEPVPARTIVAAPIVRAPVVEPEPPQRTHSPAIADLLDGMLAQERRERLAS